MSRKALGRGLSALIPTETEDVRQALHEGVRELPVESIRANPWQPRSEIAEEAMDELVASIRQKGVLQPILVRRAGDAYELVAGERRFVASKMAGLTSVPVIVREVSDREMVELALVENLQREDLNPIDQAKAYKRLQDEFGLTQEQIAERVGKDRASVANQIRLLQLPGEVQAYVSRGTLTAGHGKALLIIEDPARQLELGRWIATKGLSVREAEKLAGARPRVRRRKARRVLTIELAAMEDRLRDHLATKVSIKPSGRGGAIEIEYYSDEDLERLLERMGAWHGPVIM